MRSELCKNPNRLLTRESAAGALLPVPQRSIKLKKPWLMNPPRNPDPQASPPPSTAAKPWRNAKT